MQVSCDFHRAFPVFFLTAPENFLLVSQTGYMSRIVFQSSSGELGVVPGEEAPKRGSPVKKRADVSPSPDAVLPIRGIEVGQHSIVPTTLRR